MSKYRVLISQQFRGLMFISIYPDDDTKKIAVIVPCEKQGSWACGQDVNLVMLPSITRLFPVATADKDIQIVMTNAAGLPADSATFASFA